MVISWLLSSLSIVLILTLLPEKAIADTAVFSEPATRTIAAGPFIRGSDRKEREMAYQLDEKAYGHSRTRTDRWYESEFDREVVKTADFSVTTTLITNAEYALFMSDTGHPAPNVTLETWREYGLVHPYNRTRKFAWKKRAYPHNRGDHPVVLVSWADATSYAVWLSRKTGKHWQLPTEIQWEKAARGTDGLYFPWGNDFDPTKLNSHDLGPFDTVPVGKIPDGNSPFGIQDMAGQVFEWTREKLQDGRVIVKGGSWDDKGCGVCRPAARHSRPAPLKHILIGFRLVYEM